MSMSMTVFVTFVFEVLFLGSLCQLKKLSRKHGYVKELGSLIGYIQGGMSSFLYTLIFPSASVVYRLV